MIGIYHVVLDQSFGLTILALWSESVRENRIHILTDRRVHSSASLRNIIGSNGYLLIYKTHNMLLFHVHFDLFYLRASLPMRWTVYNNFGRPEIHVKFVKNHVNVHCSESFLFFSSRAIIKQGD